MGDLESNSDSDASSSIEDNPDELQDVSASTAIETLLLLISILAIGLCITSIVMDGSYITYFMLFCSFLAPYTWSLQRSFTDIKALQETYQTMVQEVDTLKVENEMLGSEVLKLNQTVERLNDVEGALDVITKKQGQGVAEFARQVKESKKLLKKMKKNFKATVLQSLLSIVMSSDEDGDFSIDDRETEELIGRLKKINGVTLKEDKFRSAIKKTNGSLNAVLDMVRDLVKNEDIPSEEQIFIIAE